MLFSTRSKTQRHKMPHSYSLTKMSVFKTSEISLQFTSSYLFGSRRTLTGVISSEFAIITKALYGVVRKTGSMVF